MYRISFDARGLVPWLSFKTHAVAVGHADAADDGPHNPDKTLVGSAKKNVGQVGCAVKLFVRGSINSTIVMPGEASNRLWGEHIGVDHLTPEIRHEPHGGFHGVIVLSDLGSLIFVVGQVAPVVMVGKCGDSNDAIGKFAIFGIINVVVR